MNLPNDAAARKAIPLCTGVLDYFPDALAEVAKCSQAGNDQHNPGSALHWDRAKSGDESDALLRHQAQRGTFDSDGIRHSAKVAWRALAQLQKELEAAGAPLARGARGGKGEQAGTSLRFDGSHFRAYDAHLYDAPHLRPNTETGD
jgi:hypothetical protein